MLEMYQKLYPKPQNLQELRAPLQMIWADFPQRAVDRAVQGVHERLQACVAAVGAYLELFFCDMHDSIL